MKLRKAFSLIELMVVIVIIGILAAIGVMAYKNYMQSANLSKVMSIVDGLVQQSITYANQHGSYATAGLLANTAAQIHTVASTGISADFINVLAKDISAAHGGTANCGAAGIVSVAVKSSTLGIGTNPVVVNCLLAHKSGSVDTTCFYTYSNTGASNAFTTNTTGARFVVSPVSGNLMPGVTNPGTVAAANTLISTFFTDASCM